MIEAIAMSGEPDSQRRSCCDCRHCQAVVNWWCRNPEAIAYRGSSIPDAIHCHYWEPMRRPQDLSRWERVILDLPPLLQARFMKMKLVEDR